MMHVALFLAMALSPSPQKGVTELRDEWASNLRSKQVEANLGEYTEDADFIDSTGNRIQGTAAIRQLFKTITATFDSDLAFTSLRVESSGDLTYDSGTYKETLTTRATGQRQQSTGSYLTVYRRDKDGHWLIVEQVWTGTPLEKGAK